MHEPVVVVPERMRRVAQLWNWLPAFRASAESEHLPSASALIGVSAPALSRTLHLLEDALGVALFDRVGRRLRLNAGGEILVAAVRKAMRLVDDALDEVAGVELVGGVHLAAWGSHMAPLVLPTIRDLQTRCPRIQLHVEWLRPARVASGLREGALDLAITDGPIEAPDLEVERLGDLTYGVYVGPGHPLHGRRVAPAELAGHPFVAPIAGIDDRWPAELPRTIAARLGSLRDAAALCASGALVAVLPDGLAREPEGPRALWRLDVDVRPEPIYLVRRAPLGPHPRLEVVLAALRRHAVRPAADAEAGPC